VFEGDFWGETVVEFSHSLGQKQPSATQRITGSQPVFFSIMALNLLCDLPPPHPSDTCKADGKQGHGAGS
jgi:hypothetical protein